MMQISHESPNDLLELSRGYNDYDYCLLPIAIKDKKYLEFFKESIRLGRRVILDSGLWEGHIPELEEYLDFAIKEGFNELLPLDMWGKSEYTINKAKETREYLDNKGYSDIRLVGVIHGVDQVDYQYCYYEMSRICDTLAFSWEDFFKNSSREEVLSKLDINKNKKHHILGITQPKDVIKINQLGWVDSIDTSSPVLHGCLGIEYNDEGLEDKSDTKIIDIYNDQVSLDNIQIVSKNISLFRKWSNII